MGIRSKAAHFVSDLATVLLNPISDKPSKPSTTPHPEPETESGGNTAYLTSDDDSEDSGDGPDTSSFTAFLVSLLSNSETGKNHPNPDGENVYEEDVAETSGVPILRDSGRKRSIFSRGKQSLSKIYHATRIGGFRNQGSAKGNSDMVVDQGSDIKVSRDEEISAQNLKEPLPLDEVPETSEPSLLLSEKTRNIIFASLPVIVQGRKWLLLYSTWRHGISISTLYRRSMLWPGLSLLVVGDCKGAVFGGLVEAPLRPTNKRRYQGSNNSFVFTNVSGDPAIFRPTGSCVNFVSLSRNPDSMPMIVISSRVRIKGASLAFPPKYNDCVKLYFCEFCLNFMKRKEQLQRHMRKCDLKHPPGDEIYRCVTLSMFEGMLLLVY